MVLMTYFPTKMAQIFGAFWDNIENLHFLGYFWATFLKIGLLFTHPSGHTGG